MKTKKSQQPEPIQAPPVTVREKFEAGQYNPKTPWSKETRAAFCAEQGECHARFQADIIAENGLTGHPKADLLYQKAWERGHAYGLSEVASVFEDLAELLK